MIRLPPPGLKGTARSLTGHITICFLGINRPVRSKTCLARLISFAVSQCTERRIPPFCRRPSYRLAGLKRAFQDGQFHFHGNLALLARSKIFAAWVRQLFRKDWVVYAKHLFGGPEYVLQYLGRYTHRVAISNHRLVSFGDGKVTFRWQDSAHHNEQKLLTLSLDEFLRRFLMHLLPQGFVRIRNFGFLANRRRATLLPFCFHLFGAAQKPLAQPDASSTNDSSDLWRCPKCDGPMKVIERFTATEMQLRSPPKVTAAA